MNKFFIFFKTNLIYILIFCLSFGIRLYSISQKDFVHHDEPYSFICSTPNNLSPDGKVFKKRWDNLVFEYGKNYNVKDIKKSIFGSDKSFKSVITDLKTLRTQNIDNDHSNLYYSLIRIWNMGYDGQNFKDAVWRGCSLNLILFCLSFFFMFKLLSLIKDDKKFISLGLFFGFISTGSISNTIFIREYALAEAFFIICTYLTVKLGKIIVERGVISSKKIIGYPLVFALLALAGYFSLIYDAILAFILITLCLIYRRNYLLIQISMMILFSIFYILLIYPNFFIFLFNNNYTYYLYDRIDIFNLKPCYSYYYELSHIDFPSFIFYKDAVLLIVYLYACVFFTILFGGKELLFEEKSFSKNEFKLCLFVLLTAAFWDLCIYLLKTIVPGTRFFLESFPLLALFFVILIYPFRKKWVIPTVVLYLILSVIPVVSNNYKIAKMIYLHNDNEYSKPYPEYVRNYLLENNIIKPAKDNYNKFTLSPEYPVVVVRPTLRHWYYCYYYFTMLENKGIIRFEDEIPDSNFQYRNYILFKPYYIFLFLKFKPLKIPDFKTKIAISYWEDYFTSIYFVDYDKTLPLIDN